MTYDITYVIGGAARAPGGGQEFVGVRMHVTLDAPSRPDAYAAVCEELTAAGFDVVVAPHGPRGTPLGFSPAECDAVRALGVPFEGDRLSRPAAAGVQIERIEAHEGPDHVVTVAPPPAVMSTERAASASIDQTERLEHTEALAEPAEPPEPPELVGPGSTPSSGHPPVEDARRRAYSGLLERVAAGQATFELPPGADAAAGAAFDETVKHLLVLQRRGFLVVPTPTANLRSHVSEYEYVGGVHLTDAGLAAVEREGGADLRLDDEAR